MYLINTEDKINNGEDKKSKYKSPVRISPAVPSKQNSA
jgi:hypothetical protein